MERRINRRMNGGDCITCHIDAVGNYTILLGQSNKLSLCLHISDEELEGAVTRTTEVSEEMISSHEEMISSACSLELTTSTSDGLSDKENVVRLLKQHVNTTSNRLSNTVRYVTCSQLITAAQC